jgi:hypothetical protein
MIRRFALALGAAALLLACDTSTSKLTNEEEARFAAEGILRRADDQHFRYTRDPGGRSERWEDRKASIIVTKSSLLIHKNAKVGLEITPRSQRELSVSRTGSRVRIYSGRGRSEEVWSFEPPDDADGWTRDIRALIKSTKGSRQ